MTNIPPGKTSLSGSKSAKRFAVLVIVAGMFWAGVALAAVLAYIYGGPEGQGVGLSILILFAAGATGGIGGLLFGVPKSVPNTEPGGVRSAYQPNSNLEQVSDWLTKIIVGVGLIEFRQIIEALGALAVKVGAAFGDELGSPGKGAMYGLTLILGGTLISFICTYMWMRTRFFEVLARQMQGAAEPSASREIPG